MIVSFRGLVVKVDSTHGFLLTYPDQLPPPSLIF